MQCEAVDQRDPVRMLSCCAMVQVEWMASCCCVSALLEHADDEDEVPDASNMEATLTTQHMAWNGSTRSPMSAAAVA